MSKLEKPKHGNSGRTGQVEDLDRSVSGAARSARRKREFVQDYKLEKGCESPDCGWDKEFIPEQLQLDHINPSTKNPKLRRDGKRETARGLVSLSWDDLIEEIQKCQVLCANCHAERTFSEGHHK